ncbi:uncharacterized protein LOC111338964 [Stylophora pistillata]|uniref:uncharacterized protein LOC111338964 n=1 Tax=Stylophora pistillata TaxID=50429 RepID=UPI000C04DBC7|nr:uncharacterized protein LOC111338964 [Stylophora pistillata]
MWIMAGILTAVALCTNLKATASSPPTETSVEACSNGSLTIQWKGFTDLNTIKGINWKIKFPDSRRWRDLSHCTMSDDECSEVPRLPHGITVQSITKQNVAIERFENNSTIDHVKIMCAVDQHTSTGTNTKLYIYDISFVVQCAKPVEGRNLNLTRILQNMVTACERVSYVHWSINGSNFASCDSCQGCENCSKKGREGSNDEVSLDFRRRLRFTGGLILTNI